MGKIERRLLCGFWLATMLPAAWAEVPFNPYGKPQSSDSEIRAQAAERKAAKLERQLREAQRTKAASPSAEKSAISPAPPAMQNYAPLSVFQDKLSDGSLGPEMVVIPSGSFDMGSPEGGFGGYGESPVQRISLKAYALGKTEVTQKQWRQVMGSDSAELRVKGCDDCPVTSVSWHEAQRYIEQLKSKTGMVYRLPSESEWEYACRGGKAGEEYCGGNDVAAVGWYGDNKNGSESHPVGQKQKNGYGLHDMSGNACEWVEDVIHGNYNGIPLDGSAWTTGGSVSMTPGGGQDRVVRGGSWYGKQSDLRSAHRDNFPSRLWEGCSGFRLAKTLP